ncbi:MAG: DUF4411 family protein [Actinomycetia bacterium]|nr:DUF4411 family protein [Actinomycetes bacterium]
MTDLLYSFDTSVMINGRRDLLPPEAEYPRLVGKGGQRNLADSFVIGLARARGGIVVTQEAGTNNLERPRIPDVCGAMGVRCVDLVGFIRDQGWSF